MNRLICTVALFAAGCAHKPEARTVEAVAPTGLSYSFNIDSTRVQRGTGLPAVPAVVRLLEDDLGKVFRLLRLPNAASETRQELLAEATAPGYGVHAVVEARPDDFCAVMLDVVTIGEGGKMERTPEAPYSVHEALGQVRTALGSLQEIHRPTMTAARFADLRKQAIAVHAHDPPMDATTFIRSPHPLQPLDAAPRYYAPTDSPSTLLPKN